MLLNNAGSADFLDTRDEEGNSPLFYAIFFTKLSCVENLVERGADVHARNNHRECCLHRFFRSDCHGSDDLVEEVQLLVFLIRNGADIDAVDDQGICLRECAYAPGHDNDVSVWGDLWDRVLVECGYDLLARRKAFSRRPAYTKKYPRKDFEEIWAGWECYCPYYDDPPEWPPHWPIRCWPTQFGPSSSGAYHIAGTVGYDGMKS